MRADPNKIYRIDHGVVLDNFKIKKRTGIVDKIGIRNHKKYLLYIGRIDVKKGIELLLLAFAKLIKKYNNVFLVVAGSGSEDYVKKLKKLTGELNIEDFVSFTGFVTEDEKLELLESAKLFVLTSHSDVHPIAVQDALTMGVPVVVTESCDFPEVVEYNAGVLVKPDVVSIYYGLSKMLENDTILSLLSQNAKKLVEEKFLLEKQIKKYEEMYLDVIKNHNKSIKK